MKHETQILGLKRRKLAFREHRSMYVKKIIQIVLINPDKTYKACILLDI